MKNLSVQSMNFPALKRQLRRWLIAGTALLAVTAVLGCGATGPSEPVQVAATAPEVSYQFNTDQELIEANQRARVYCSQYGSTPTMEGTIIRNSDGSKTVNFKCVLKTVSAPVTPPRNYDYRTDNDLLRAMQAADVYCAQSGQLASYSVSTNASGTQTLEYRCVPR